MEIYKDQKDQRKRPPLVKLINEQDRLREKSSKQKRILLYYKGAGGKRDKKLILPINGSLSASLDMAQLCAKTTIMLSSTFKKDRIWLNGIEESLETPRHQSVLREIRRLARKRKIVTGSEEGALENGEHLTSHVHICSENNFPTAAGLASSAAGYACLAFTLAKLYGVEDDVSVLARQGSGSACRSVYGGWVEWRRGERDDGTDSVARVVADNLHWPEMRVLILVVSAQKKAVSSAGGMELSVCTSQLLQHRAQHTVPSRLEAMKTAILNKDFKTFAELTMKDSNEMHACCLDTYPPISYMTDTSRQIQSLVHHINSLHAEPVVAYTFDAGPNACLYLLENAVDEVLAYVKHCFAPAGREGKNWLTGLPCKAKKLTQEELNEIPVSQDPGAVQYVISTKVGEGPKVLSEEESLLHSEGVPKYLSPK